MLKKLLEKLLGYPSKSHYRKFSSSDYGKHNHSHHRHGQNHSHGHSHYGHSHYKKKHSSFSFFSS